MRIPGFHTFRQGRPSPLILSRLSGSMLNVLVYGRPGPYRPLIVTERIIIITISSSSTFYDTCQALAGLQERFAGPAPRGEGQRMPSCLPVKIIDAKFNVTTIFPDRTGRAGRADGRPGPYRPQIVTERSIISSSSTAAAALFMIPDRHWHRRRIKSCEPGTSRCGDKIGFISGVSCVESD